MRCKEEEERIQIISKTQNRDLPPSGPVSQILSHIDIYICQDGGAVGFVDFTKVLFALLSLAQPFNRVRSIPEPIFIILSQRKAYAGHSREETAEKEQVR